MPIGSVALLASCALRMTLGDATFYDVSLRTEARGRNRAAISGVLGEVEADPRIGLTWQNERGELGAAYLPRLMLQEKAGGLQVLHRASAEGAWQLNEGWRALASATGSYGTNDLLLSLSGSAPGAASVGAGAAPPGAAPQPVQPIPQLTTLKYVSAEATAGASGTLSARSRALARISAFVDGGADDLARTQLPLQHGGRFFGELEWDASRRDVLASSLIATATAFPGILDVTLFVAETWRRALASDVQLRVGAGPSLTAQRASGNTSWTVAPGGEIGVHARREEVLEIDVGVRAAPIVDRTSGAAYERADGTLAVTWRVSSRWTLGASGTAGIVAEGAQGGDKIVAGDTHAAWSPTTNWELSVGARAIAQSAHASPVGHTTEATLFVAVTARDRL